MDRIKALYSSRYPARSFSLLRVILFLLITGTIAAVSYTHLTLPTNREV